MLYMPSKKNKTKKEADTFLYMIIYLVQMIMEYDGPIVVDFQVIPDANCYPMVAPGKNNAQMIGIFKRKLTEKKVF